jgi:SAM-dependent methyltransferase
MFQVHRCPACGYAFVANPWDDFEKIYNEEYYRGRGPDPLVDYVFELEHPRETIRQFEWQGIVQAIGNLVPLNPRTRWLDFGCGNGGLVRYCRETAACDAVGFEEGWISHRAAEHGIPILDSASLARARHSFDVVTAIEVIEHTINPLEVFQTIRGLLKPGGLFFLTTGNAEPFVQRLLDWPYILPEIHVSFFEPRTLHRALEKTGFRVAYPGFCPGYEHIIKFKMLKNLRFHRRMAWLNVVPWRTLARICDARLKITALPIGWAVG